MPGTSGHLRTMAPRPVTARASLEIEARVVDAHRHVAGGKLRLAEVGEGSNGALVVRSGKQQDLEHGALLLNRRCGGPSG
jgi:hypothetical protein